MHLEDTPARSMQVAPAKRRLSAWGLLTAASTVAGTATAAGFLARLCWAFELAVHFRVQYAAFLALAALAFLIGKRRKSALAAGAFALVNLIVVLPIYAGPPSVPGGGGGARVLLANINTANRAHEKVLSLIRSANPDIMILLEVNRAWVSELRALEADYPYALRSPREDNFGIALFSRLPFTDGRVAHLGRPALPSIIARFEVGGRPLTLIGTHALPPLGSRYSRARNQHLEALADLAALQEDPVMVLGDLNVTPWSPFFRDLLRDGALRNARKGYGLRPTWPTMLPPLLIPVDHCLVSSGVVVHDCRAGRNVGSDHYPLVVDFSLRPP